MDRETFIAEAQRDFAKYGFATQPMNAGEIGRCFDVGLTLDDTYGVGCDMNAGLSLVRAINIATDRMVYRTLKA